MSSLTLLETAWRCVLPSRVGFRTAEERTAERIRDAANNLHSRAPEELRAEAIRLQAQVGKEGKRLETYVVPAFALMFEAIRRTTGLEMFDVQLLAGLALARGAVAEMQTGEGKTLAAALPAFLYGLQGRGVHVVTPNAYLAERDWQQLAPAYELLGIRAGLLRERVPPEVKRAAYDCDVTYGTGYEFGFDYLRDQLARMSRRRHPLGCQLRELLQGRSTTDALPLQRGHSLAIVDEIDSVLIDEACLPLVLSETPHDSAETSPAAIAAYHAAQRVTENLSESRDFQLDREANGVTLTESGLARVHAQQTQHSQLTLARPWSAYVENALRANYLLRRDVDYVREDQRVLIVDEFTGRVFTDRCWRDGLHQAIEAKEALPIRAEMVSAARISRQCYFQRYERLCGMTGTAAPSAREFRRLYQLRVVAVPPRIPSRRVTLPTRFFRDHEAKWQAIVRAMIELHRFGRPVLVGTRTIENSQVLASKLHMARIPFRLLNGRQDLAEAEVVATAGERRAITIATNMAGRGTDIRLERGAAELGGMHLLGVERHESPRIDQQLMGRVARQGDPGSCQFYVSADDSLLIDHAPELSRRMRNAPATGGELAADFSEEVFHAQRRAESAAYAGRRRIMAYDTWLDEVLTTLAKD